MNTHAQGRSWRSPLVETPRWHLSPAFSAGTITRGEVCNLQPPHLRNFTPPRTSLSETMRLYQVADVQLPITFAIKLPMTERAKLTK
jgi:hypothetical protein